MTDQDNISSRLVVNVFNARNLIPGDINGLSDPYVVIQFNNFCKRTSVKYKTLNPEWNESLNFEENKSSWFLAEDIVHISVRDHDVVGSDTKLGSFSIPLWGFLDKCDKIQTEKPESKQSNQKSNISDTYIPQNPTDDRLSSGLESSSDSDSCVSLASLGTEPAPSTSYKTDIYETRENYYYKLAPKFFKLQLKETSRVINSEIQFSIQFYPSNFFTLQRFPCIYREPVIIARKRLPKVTRMNDKVIKARSLLSDPTYEFSSLLSKDRCIVNFTILRGMGICSEVLEATYSRTYMEIKFRELIYFSDVYTLCPNPLFNASVSIGNGIQVVTSQDCLEVQLFATKNKRIRKSTISLGYVSIPICSILRNEIRWVSIAPTAKLLLQFHIPTSPVRCVAMKSQFFQMSIRLVCFKQLAFLMSKVDSGFSNKFFAVIMCGKLTDCRKVLPIDKETIGFPIFDTESREVFEESDIAHFTGISSSDTIVIQLKRRVNIKENRSRFKLSRKLKGKKEATELIATLCIDVDALLTKVGYIDGEGKTLVKWLSCAPNLHKTLHHLAENIPIVKTSIFLKPMSCVASKIQQLSFVRLERFESYQQHQKGELSIRINANEVTFNVSGEYTDLCVDTLVPKLPQTFQLSLHDSKSGNILGSNNCRFEEQRISIYSNAEDKLGLLARLQLSCIQVRREIEHIPVLGQLSISPLALVSSKHRDTKFNLVIESGNTTLRVDVKKLVNIAIADLRSSLQLKVFQSDYLLASGSLSALEVIECNRNMLNEIDIKLEKTKQFYGYLRVCASFVEELDGVLADRDAKLAVASWIGDFDSNEGGLSLTKVLMNEFSRTAAILDWSLNPLMRTMRAIFNWHDIRVSVIALLVALFVHTNDFVSSRILAVFPMYLIYHILGIKFGVSVTARKKIKLTEEDTKLKVTFYFTGIYDNRSPEKEFKDGMKVELYNLDWKPSKNCKYMIKTEKFMKSYHSREPIIVFPKNKSQVSTKHLEIKFKELQYSDEFLNLKSPRIVHLNAVNSSDSEKLTLLPGFSEPIPFVNKFDATFFVMGCDAADLGTVDCFEFSLESFENNTCFYASVSMSKLLSLITEAPSKYRVNISTPVYFRKRSEVFVGNAVIEFHVNKLLMEDLLGFSQTQNLVDIGELHQDYSEAYIEQSWFYNSSEVVLKVSQKTLVEKQRPGSGEVSSTAVFTEEYVEMGAVNLNICELLKQPGQLIYTTSILQELSSDVSVGLEASAELPDEGSLQKYMYQEEMRKTSTINFWDILKVKRIFQAKLVQVIKTLQFINDNFEKMKNLVNWTHPTKTHFVLQVCIFVTIGFLLIPTRLIFLLVFLFVITERYRPTGIYVIKFRHMLSHVPTDAEVASIYETGSVSFKRQEESNHGNTSDHKSVAISSEQKKKLLNRTHTGSKMRSLAQKSSRDAIKQTLYKGAKATQEKAWSNFRRVLKK